MKYLILFFFCLTLSNDSVFKEGSYRAMQNSYCGIAKGALVITNRAPDMFEFKINVSNTGGIGKIEGTARIWDLSHAYANIEIELEDEPSEWTRLKFSVTPDGKWIHVDVENSSWWHGAEVCFDGFYEIP